MSNRALFPATLAVLMIVGLSAPSSSEESAGPGARYAYPGSAVSSVSTAGGMTQSVVVTSDPIPTVLAFYEKLLGEKLQANCGHGPRPDGSTIVCCNDSYAITSGSTVTETPRSVEVRVISGVMGSHVFSVTITRAEADAMTHIVLTYTPK